MADWVKTYQHLPYPLRVGVASARGLYLRWWRHGRETERLVKEALERDHWDAAQWDEWRRHRLSSLLRHAATNVPFYREQWSERRRSGDESPIDHLENWPVLTKETVRRHPELFLSDASRRGKLLELHTSGTTGKPLKLWRSRKTNIQWYALCQARLLQWNGVPPSDRCAVLGGQLVVKQSQTGPPFWVWNACLHQLYMSSYHLSPRNLPSYVEALHEYRVSYVEGYASSLYALAQELLRGGSKPNAIRVVISNAEPLFAHQRHVIREAFGCPVRDTYGMTEIVVGASECERGRPHLWPEAGLAEVLLLDVDRPVAEEEVGRLVCTGFINEDMPLIRYEVGDRVRFAAANRSCECGRALPLLLDVEGRLDDVIVTADGRRIGRLDPVFKGDFPVREAQIIQESLTKLLVRIVPAEQYDSRHGAALVARLRERVGGMNVEIEAVESIPRDANGKFRAVISRLPSSLRENASDNGSVTARVVPE